MSIESSSALSRPAIWERQREHTITPLRGCYFHTDVLLSKIHRASRLVQKRWSDISRAGTEAPGPARRPRAADLSLTFLVILVRAGPGARPVLRFALGARSLLLLGARTLAEVDALGQTRQVLGHGQRLQVRLSAIQAHLLDLLLAGRLDADPHGAHPRHSRGAGEAKTPPQEPKIKIRTEAPPWYPGTWKLPCLCGPSQKQTRTLGRNRSCRPSHFPRMHCRALRPPSLQERNWRSAGVGAFRARTSGESRRGTGKNTRLLQAWTVAGTGVGRKFPGRKCRGAGP